MVTTLYLIRHCEAEGNINDTFQGKIDQDITEKGAKQLERLSERCRDIHLDVIYSSPLIRAYKTAEAINKYHGLDIITDEAFSEIDGGEFEGCKWDQLPLLFPNTYELWKNKFALFKTEKGESMAQVYKRVSDGIMKVVRENTGKSIAVASHGCAIRNMCCFLKGLGLDRIEECEWVDNTGISCFSFDDNFKAKEVFINDCSHLMNDPELAPHQMFWRNKNSG